MRWMFRPHVLQHRPNTLSMFLALHHVQGKLSPLQWFSVAPQIQHSNVSAECLLSKAELPSLQQALGPASQGKCIFLL